MSMFEKKDPGKFTVRFNPADPQQRTVIELLNQQGRYKAQFLTSAILHYVHCPETPDIMGVPATDSREIERIVRDVLAQQQTAPFQGSPQRTSGTTTPWEDAPAPPSQTGQEDTEEAERDAIFKTLDAFRPKQ